MAEEPDPANRHDAVCFTAGPGGAFFSAGVVHAHMAADRPAPAIVAGISTGAISAAAMQRAYKEYLGSQAGTGPGQVERVEAARWAWLRHYIAQLTDDPASVLWDSIPNPTDFFADQNAPSLRDFSLSPELQIEQMHANRQRFLLTSLGAWAARLPIRVSTVTTALVRFVRHKERYTGNWFTRWFLLMWSRMTIGGNMLWHVIRNPVFVNESVFDGTRAMPRPLLGWRLYAAALALPAALIVVALLFMQGWSNPRFRWAALLFFLTAAVGMYAGWSLLVDMLIRPVLASIGFGRSLLNNFPLRWRLYKVFGTHQLDASPMPVLIVTAPLQTLYRKDKAQVSRQLWAKPCSGITCVDAITAAVAMPGVWPPWLVRKDKTSQWEPLEDDDPLPLKPALDLVDGSAVRQNPMPALLQYLWRHEAVAKALERGNADGTWPVTPVPSIHVVYSVPLSGPSGNGHVREEDANIVNVGLAAQELAQRRDTRLEVDQLTIITRLEIEVRSAGGKTPQITLAMADEIAPPADPAIATDFRNPLSPGREQAYTKVAEGCRGALEKLYGAELAQLSDIGTEVPCEVLLKTIAANRPWNLKIETGLPEVCTRCTGKLRPPKKEHCEPIPALTSLGFENLKVRRPDGENGNKAQPRIVFVWSGGVFRGSFHIGMIGALLRANIKPDLIAGASVGTLMGGALASMFSAPEEHRVKRLSNLVDTFLRVDRNVALTRTLKEASRDLGIRGRGIRLSPAMIRRQVLAGTQADAGYAAAAAPPALIDAISSLFAIPLEETRGIASKFIAGLVAEAAHQGLLSIKKHTLARLNIEYAVLGASLLEQRVRELIEDPRVDTTALQPFQKAGIAFLATTTNLGAQSQVVLGDSQLARDKPFDFIHAALASSAFPAVFAPRRACEVFPGWGRFDVRYSDGGMFDNLPFVPAILALSRVQMEESEIFRGDLQEMKRYIADRHANPDLFLTGALDANPENHPDRDGPFNYFNEISARAVSLGNNSKIHSFTKSALLAHSQFGRLKDAVDTAGSDFRFKDPDFVRSYVNVSVLTVFPTNREHLNPTFAFCKSTGLNARTLLNSIADGCFQTFRNLANGFKIEGPLKQSLTQLHAYERVPAITVVPFQQNDTAKQTCPFFRMNGKAFLCPFAEAEHMEVYRLCWKDKEHVNRDD